MKNITFLSAIICILLLTSCGESPSQTDIGETTITSAAVTTVPEPVETTAAKLELTTEEASASIKPPTVKVNTINSYGLEIGLYYCSPWAYEWAYPDENGNMVSEVTDVPDALEHLNLLNEISTEEVDSVKLYFDSNQPQPTVISVFRYNEANDEFENADYKDSFTISPDGGEVYKLSITFLQGTADYYFRTVKADSSAETEQSEAAQ